MKVRAFLLLTVLLISQVEEIKFSLSCSYARKMCTNGFFMLMDFVRRN